MTALHMQWLLRILCIPGAEVPALGHELQHLLGCLGFLAGFLHPACRDAELTRAKEAHVPSLLGC